METITCECLAEILNEAVEAAKRTRRRRTETIIVQRPLGRVRIKVCPFDVTYISDTHRYYLSKKGTIYEGDPTNYCRVARIADLPASSRRSMLRSLREL